MNIVLASLTFAAASAAHSPFRPLPPEPGQAEPAGDRQAKKAVPQEDAGQGGLPYAFGKRFRTLSQYLLHLQNHAAPVDLPWWRKVGPDTFEHMTTKRIPQARREVATRAQLMQRYGFDR